MTFDEFSESFKVMKAFGVTNNEQKILALLVFREQASYDALITNLWNDADAEPEFPQNVIKVQVWRMRKKLKQFGIDIQIKWGKGYFISKEDQVKAKDLAEKAMNR